MQQLSTASLEYVRVQVAAQKLGVWFDPTGDTVTMAFIRGETAPQVTDWKTAVWDTDPTTVPATYRAQCLVGPSGTVTLAAGVWTVWVKVADSPETPVKRAGQIRVF